MLTQRAINPKRSVHVRHDIVLILGIQRHQVRRQGDLLEGQEVAR
jgi:hypothetical protein